MNSSVSSPFIQHQLIAAAPSANERVLGLQTLGNNIAAATSPFPVQHISAPVLNSIDSALHELWLSDTTCRDGRFGDIIFRRNDTLLFGVIEIDESTLQFADTESSLCAAAEHTYRQIFALLDAEGFPYLWRTWNYLPNIHAEECGLERYRQFNVGRHNAFANCKRSVDSSPAASALGTRAGIFSVAFIAGHIAPNRIENPRQISAFEYPAQYGPRSPTFTRAVTVADKKYEALFISGTASIVGHETLHRGDVSAQTKETVANLAALLEQANRAQHAANANNSATLFALENLSYRIYLRYADDLKKVRAVLDALLGHSICATYVQADICRQDLLIEIEAFASRPITNAS